MELGQQTFGTLSDLRILPQARFLTVGSQAMGETYAARYGVSCQPINNVFALPETPPPAEDRFRRA